MTDYYVYTHSLSGNPPFYVGKGMLRRTRTIERPHNTHHTNIVNKYGKENIVVRAMLCKSETHALALEVKLIAALRNGGLKLTNATDGGEGTSGRKMSSKTRAKLYASNAGRKMSPEHKARLIEINTGRKLPPEHMAKLVAANRGKTHTAETKLKMSQAKAGHKQAPEHVTNAKAARKASQLLKKLALVVQQDSTLAS